MPILHPNPAELEFSTLGPRKLHFKYSTGEYAAHQTLATTEIKCYTFH